MNSQDQIAALMKERDMWKSIIQALSQGCLTGVEYRDGSLKGNHTLTVFLDDHTDYAHDHGRVRHTDRTYLNDYDGGEPEDYNFPEDDDDDDDEEVDGRKELISRVEDLEDNVEGIEGDLDREVEDLSEDINTLYQRIEDAARDFVDLEQRVAKVEQRPPQQIITYPSPHCSYQCPYIFREQPIVTCSGTGSPPPQEPSSVCKVNVSTE
jgi:hypothetical protein